MVHICVVKTILNNVKQIAIFDAGIAFLAGLMIVPAVFAFNRDALGAWPWADVHHIAKSFYEYGAAPILQERFSSYRNLRGIIGNILNGGGSFDCMRSV